MTDALSERYRSPSPRAQRATVLGSGLLGVAALGWLLWVTVVHATPQVSSQLVGWETVDDHLVTARVDVDLDEGIAPDEATCRVRAIAADHTVVGELEFNPVAGRNQVEVRTERRATSVESVGCTTPDQRRPR